MEPAKVAARIECGIGLGILAVLTGLVWGVVKLIELVL
jgi:hypothetical protein